MAPAPTTRSTPTHRRSVRAVVAMVVLALVGAVVVLADGAGGRRAVAPSLRPVLLAVASVPTPPPLEVGAIAPLADDAEEGLGVADVDAAVEVASTGAAVPAPPPSPPSVPAELEPVPAVPVAAPTTEPPMPEPPPAATGTLQVVVTPADDGASRQVWVQTSEGATVRERVEVAGPVVIELAPGTYAVFIENTGPPYGPDEHGIALGGGSNVTRDVVEVVAGRTTTVTCSTC